MNLQGIKNRLVKILVYSITSLLFLVIASLLALQLTPVQRMLANRFLGNFSEVVGFKTTVQNIRFSWFDRLELSGVVVEDPEHNKMFEIGLLSLNYKISTLLDGKNINFDGVYIDSARVYFTRITEHDTAKSFNINVFVNQINEQYSSAGGTGGNPKINIGEAYVERSWFALDNTGLDSLQGFDYHHFAVSVAEAQLQNFMVLGDTVEFNVNSLIAHDEKTKFGINNLSTFFRISQKAMEFKGIHLQAGQSTISDTVVFHYDSHADLSEFVTKVHINAHFDKTIIYPNDLALFASEAKRLHLPLTVSGTGRGSVNDFRLSDMEIQSGNTLLQGSVAMEGLPDVSETFIQLKLKNSRVSFNDLSFVLDDATLERLTPLGTLSLQGEFLGYPTDFVAKGNFSNNLGMITSDINLKIDEKVFERSSYKGQLSLINFDLGQYLNDTTNFQKISLDGRISGSGFSRNTANFTLVGNIKSVGIKKYNYQNIKTDARFASQFFSGTATIKDRNVQATAKGSIDLRANKNLINIQAKIDTLNLDKINIAKNNFFIQAEVDVNMQGLHLDSLTGTAHVKKLTLNYEDQWLRQNDLTVSASRNNTQRSIHLQSEVVDARIDGDYLFTSLFRDIPVLVKEFVLNIKNNKAKLTEYYAAKNQRPGDYSANFTIRLKDIQPVTSLLTLKLDAAKNITIDGHFKSGNTNLLSAFTHIDSLTYGNTLFLNTEIEINASKISDSTTALAMLYVSSAKQQTNKLFTQNLVTEAIWNKDHIDFQVNLDQQARNNYVRLNGSIDFADSTHIRLLPTSKIQLLEKTWSIHNNNSLAVKGREWNIHDFAWSNENQLISLNGRVSDNPLRELILTVQNFDLTTTNSITLYELDGIVNARLTVRDVYAQPTLQNNLTINSLKVNNFLVGDITGNNNWHTDERKFNVEFLVDRLGTRIVDCTGTYDPYVTEDALNVKAHLQKTNLKIVEPFLTDIFSNIEGTLSGLYTITGTLAKPVIRGEGEIHDGKLMIDYLKTTYQVAGFIGLRQDAIYFRNIQLTDMFRNKAKVEGEINHLNFNQLSINLNASFDNFQLLNTTARDNSLFYGQGFGSGDVRFTGPLTNLKITANATTRKNTRVSIPIAGTTSVERKDFITFVNFSDSLYQQKITETVTKKINLTGITFDFNLDVTPDAYCEIIFDLKSGDIIHGRGNGKIKLQLDTKGEFNMFGPVTFTEGGYNFTLYDIINKEFKIENGSSITWYGDPYQGQMKINASYNQLASFGPILPVTDVNILNAPQVRRKYPVKVMLKLDGPMLTPQIDFDIVANDLPKTITATTNSGGSQTFNLTDLFQSFKSRLDEQELKRQVFSLIVLRKFSPAESFNTSGSLVSSVSELFSNQLSYWMSQVDNNLEIDLDLASMDQESFNAFQLRLSYTLLNGRLRITRDGTFGNQGTTTTTGGGSVNPNTQNNYSSAIGDWTIDYLLTADGKFKVKMYSRTNVNPVNTNLNSQNAITTGVSLLYTTSFNELKDIWARNRNKNTEPTEDEENEPNNNPSVPVLPNTTGVRKDEQDR